MLYSTVDIACKTDRRWGGGGGGGAGSVLREVIIKLLQTVWVSVQYFITPLVLTHIGFAIPKQSNIPAYFTP